jgi:hypothetical protein
MAPADDIRTAAQTVSNWTVDAPAGITSKEARHIAKTAGEAHSRLTVQSQRAGIRLLLRRGTPSLNHRYDVLHVCQRAVASSTQTYLWNAVLSLLIPARVQAG